MGIRDHEEFNNTILSNDKTRLENLITSNDMIYYYIKNCLKSTPGEAVNRHCFKFSRLRDEIFFINCNICRPDNKYPIKQFSFFVNEKSFWNRFNIFLKNDKNNILKQSKSICTMDALKLVCNNRELIDRCTINLYPYEEQKLQRIINNAIGSDKDKYMGYNLVNGASCTILSYTNYNKHIWYEIMTQTVKDPTSENGLTSINADFGTYKEKTSEMFYNPNDEDYKDIMFLYL